MTLEQLELLLPRLNQLITSLGNDPEMQDLLRPVRDEKTQEYIAMGGTGWFGNA